MLLPSVSEEVSTGCLKLKGYSVELHSIIKKGGSPAWARQVIATYFIVRSRGMTPVDSFHLH